MTLSFRWTANNILSSYLSHLLALRQSFLFAKKYSIINWAPWTYAFRRKNRCARRLNDFNFRLELPELINRLHSHTVLIDFINCDYYYNLGLQILKLKLSLFFCLNKNLEFHKWRDNRLNPSKYVPIVVDWNRSKKQSASSLNVAILAQWRHNLLNCRSIGAGALLCAAKMRLNLSPILIYQSVERWYKNAVTCEIDWPRMWS